ncbi:hypothetical protein BGZ70_007522 [Mortierella alpina]|uniref:Uncharacterized protein n=1 Tax=Mortierella alpina TaxID=64518 RepID=A0A9P6J8W0_MORAP|nr:hypothetical protein BGZ70_007522 [Mortierella alpina]
MALSMDEHEAQEHQDSPSISLPQESSSTEAHRDITSAALPDDSMELTAQDTPSTSTATATELQDASDTVSKEADAVSPEDAAPDSINNEAATALEDERVEETPSPETADATDNDAFGAFGDFGSAEPKAAAQATAPGGKDDDDFDNFAAADPTLNSHNHADEDEDDDGFGDFGEVQAAGAEDDEFGDFNDFAAAGGDDFQDSGDFGDFAEGDTIDGDDPFGAQEPMAAVESQAPVAQPPVEQPVEVKIAPDFSAVNSRQVENFVLDRLSELYPLDGSLAGSSSSGGGDDTLVASPQLLNPDLDSMDTATILSEQALWTSLCETSFLGGQNTAEDEQPDSASSAPQFQWKHSILRKEYYASLGLVIAKEQASVAHTSIPNSALSPTSSRSRVSSPMVVSTETMAERKPLDLEATRAYCQFTKENLGGYSGDEMKDIIARLTELTQHASEELTHWLDQREQMIMDSERYNEMIASLVGRAAKLKDAESKQNTKTKRITRTSFHLK